jgi:hypothetical protein
VHVHTDTIVQRDLVALVSFSFECILLLLNGFDHVTLGIRNLNLYSSATEFYQPGFWIVSNRNQHW